VGFSLIELGIVLAVMSVIAGTLLPDLMQTTRNQLARQAVESVQAAQDASVQYYHTSVKDTEREDAVDPSRAVWPCEDDANTCECGDRGEPEEHGGGGGGHGGGGHGGGGHGGGGGREAGGGGHVDTPGEVLREVGMLDDNELYNAWGEPLDMFLVEADGDDIDDDMRKTLCSLVVATEVPADVYEIVQTYLPGGVCNDEDICGELQTDEPDFVRCCSVVKKPGIEAALQRSMLEEFPTPTKLFPPPAP
jgi:hypothetical protein